MLFISLILISSYGGTNSRFLKKNMQICKTARIITKCHQMTKMLAFLCTHQWQVTPNPPPPNKCHVNGIT